MKVLNIAESYPSDKQADHAGIFIHRQSVALRKLGCDIRVINPQALLTRRILSPYYRFQSELDGIKIFRPRFFYVPQIIKPGKMYDLFYGFSIWRTLRTSFVGCKPDLIVCDWIIPGGRAAAQISKSLDVPLILRARGGDVRIMNKMKAKLLTYYSEIGNQARWIVCNGHGLKNDVLKIGAFDENKLLTMSNGLDTGFFYPGSGEEMCAARASLGIPQDALVCLFVGRWEIQKGIAEIAAVLPKLLEKFPNMFFVAAGPIRDYPCRNKFLSFGSRALFLNMVDSERVRQCLHAADLFLLPSLAEGLPNSLLEAMACGVASIASAVGGIPHLIIDGKNGLLVEPSNVYSLEASIMRCASDPNYRKNLGREAQQTIREQGFDMESVVRQVYRLFQSCINNPDNVNQF